MRTHHGEHRPHREQWLSPPRRHAVRWEPGSLAGDRTDLDRTPSVDGRAHGCVGIRVELRLRRQMWQVQAATTTITGTTGITKLNKVCAFHQPTITDWVGSHDLGRGELLCRQRATGRRQRHSHARLGDPGRCGQCVVRRHRQRGRHHHVGRVDRHQHRAGQWRHQRQPDREQRRRGGVDRKRAVDRELPGLRRPVLPVWPAADLGRVLRLNRRRIARQCDVGHQPDYHGDGHGPVDRRCHGEDQPRQPADLGPEPNRSIRATSSSTGRPRAPPRSVPRRSPAPTPSRSRRSPTRWRQSAHQPDDLRGRRDLLRHAERLGHLPGRRQHDDVPGLGGNAGRAQYPGVRPSPAAPASPR